jgi:hypothetical protein
VLSWVVRVGLTGKQSVSCKEAVSCVNEGGASMHVQLCGCTSLWSNFKRAGPEDWEPDWLERCPAVEGHETICTKIENQAVARIVAADQWAAGNTRDILQLVTEDRLTQLQSGAAAKDMAKRNFLVGEAHRLTDLVHQLLTSKAEVKSANSEAA